MNTHTFFAHLALSAVLVGSFALVAMPQQASAMNKAELIESIASESGLSKADSKRALDGFINTTTKALKKGDRISLVGFGSFSVSKRANGDHDGDGYGDPDPAFVRFHANTNGHLTSNDCDDSRGPVRPEHHDADCDDDGLVTLEELKRDMAQHIAKDSAADSRRSTKEAQYRVDSFFDVFFDVVHERVGRREAVSLGEEFGTFYPPMLANSISKRSARTGRNPQTGKEIKIPAKRVVKFKAGAELSKAVN